MILNGWYLLCLRLHCQFYTPSVLFLYFSLSVTQIFESWTVTLLDQKRRLKKVHKMLLSIRFWGSPWHSISGAAQRLLSSLSQGALWPSFLIIPVFVALTCCNFLISLNSPILQNLYQVGGTSAATCCKCHKKNS